MRKVSAEMIDKYCLESIFPVNLGLSIKKGQWYVPLVFI